MLKAAKILGKDNIRNGFYGQEWKIYLRTYRGADINDIWQSVDEMCSLFKETAVWVAEELQYPFNDKEAENCMKFLNAVKNLPKDAKEINI